MCFAHVSEFCLCIALDVQRLMSFGLGIEPQVNGTCDHEDGTISPGNNQSQTESGCGSANGPEEVTDGQFFQSPQVPTTGHEENEEKRHTELTNGKMGGHSPHLCFTGVYHVILFDCCCRKCFT